MCYILWVCVCSLRHPAWIAHAPYCHLWPAQLYHIFPRYLTKGAIFEKKMTKYKMCFDFLYKFCLKHFSLYEAMSETWSKMHSGLHVKYPLFLPDFNETWIFSTVFSKNPQIWNFMKTRLVGATLFHADRRTDMTKLIVAFHNFANAPKRTVVYSLRCTINAPYSLNTAQWRGKVGRHAVLFVYTNLWPLWVGWKVKGSGVTDSVWLFRRGYV